MSQEVEKNKPKADPRMAKLLERHFLLEAKLRITQMELDQVDNVLMEYYGPTIKKELAKPVDLPEFPKRPD